MSKIVIAVNVMIEQRDKISNVLKGGNENEIYFNYDSKHKWSMIQSDGTYTLFYYPGSHSLSMLASIRAEDWPDEIDMAVYRSKDIGTKEAKDSFAELYSVLKEMKFGMDKILDEIIATDEPF